MSHANRAGVWNFFPICDDFSGFLGDLGIRACLR